MPGPFGRRPALFLGIIALAASEPAATATAQWSPRFEGGPSRFRGLCVVDDRVVWTSGTRGTVLRTTDGGRTWQPRPLPGAADLDVRDIQALDDRTACALTVGEGEKSRIYRTVDGGATWALSYTNRDPKGFLDALAFRDAGHGLALGDPVGGRFVILATEDGGRTWRPGPAEGMPTAWSGEGAFAASGTCLFVAADGRAWFGTGGARAARVFRSADFGRTWTAHETPIRAGRPSSGIFSLAIGDGGRGIAVGGDYQRPDEAGDAMALTDDDGRTWKRPAGRSAGGYRSAVAIVPGSGGRRVVAVGPTGTDASDDGGATWRRLGAAGFDAVGFAGSGAGWASGVGIIARFERAR